MDKIRTLNDLVGLVEQMKGTGSVKAKKTLLSTIEEGTFAHRILLWTYTPYACFYTAKHQPYKNTGFVTSWTEVEVEENLEKLLKALSERTVTGKAAEKAKSDFLVHLTPEQLSLVNCILTKDLKIGAKATTINSVFPDFIPEFHISLAESFDPDSLTNVYPVQVDYKYDGDRSLVFITETDVVMRSRSGFVQESFMGLFDEEFFELRRYFGQDLVLDAEITGSSFKEVSKSRGKSGDKSSLVCTVFDAMSMDNWQAKSSPSQKERTDLVRSLVRSLGGESRLEAAHSKVVNNCDELIASFDEAIENGLEGIIVKDLNAPYNWKRSRFWKKFKPEHRTDADLAIVGWQHGRSGSRFEKTIGSIILEGTIRDKPIRVRVNSGISNRLRKYFWDNRNSIAGEVWSVGYDSITQNELNEKVWSLRFPRLLKRRDDKLTSDN